MRYFLSFFIHPKNDFFVNSSLSLSEHLRFYVFSLNSIFSNFMQRLQILLLYDICQLYFAQWFIPLFFMFWDVRGNKLLKTQKMWIM